MMNTMEASIAKRKFKNPSEEKCFKHIQAMVPKVEYETVKLPYIVKHDYIPDYVVTKKDGSTVYVEYKGNGRAFDNTVKRKMIEVKKQHPEITIYIVFHTDGKCGPKRKDGTFMKQSDWAIKNGFGYCIGKDAIPKEWFE